MNRTRTVMVTEDAAERRSARAFDDMCEASGLTNGQLGAHLGCGEKFVRNLRAGIAPVRGKHVVQLPHALAADFTRRLVAASEECHGAPIIAQTVEGQAVVLGQAAAELSAEIFRAIGNDGRIDAGELVKIAARHVAVDRAERGLVALAGGLAS